MSLGYTDAEEKKWQRDGEPFICKTFVCFLILTHYMILNKHTTKLHFHAVKEK